MKRKTLITSILVIVVCLALISGSTYSLFTSESSVNIAVTSGKVDVSADVTDLKVYSATTDPVNSAGEAGTLTGTFAGTYYYDKLDGTTFTNGGTATWATDTKVLTIDKITPGDKVTLNVSVTNNSNVKAKYRVRVNALESINAVESLKLFEGLAVSVGGTALEGVIRVSPWTQLDVNAVIPEIPVEIVLPLGAGNEYQNLKTEIQIIVEAVQDNAATNAELETINAFLATKTPTTMYAAVKSLADNSVLGLTSYAEAFAKVESYLWNVDTNQFYAESDATDFAYKYFKVYKEMPTTQTYSIYAGSEWTATTVPGLTVGFDAGVTSGITSITYDRSTATYGQEVVIRTNSFNTTVNGNGPNDVINHYGEAGSVNIQSIDTQSYHEYGTVAFAEISNGRIAIEKGGKITNLHISSKKDINNQTTNEFNEIIVSIDKDADKPTFSRDDVEISANGTLVVALQEGTEAIQEDTKLDYVWLTKQGIFEQIKVSDSNTSMDDAKWADDQELQNTNTQSAAIEIANNITRNDTTNKVEATIEVDNTTYNVSLNEETRELVVKQGEEVVEEAETVQTVIEDSIVATGLNDEQKEAAKTDIVNTTKYEGFINDGYSFVVGNQGYETIQEAFENVEDNQTITLIQDVDFVASAEDVNAENFSYWQGSGYSTNYPMYSYIHLNNKKGIIFDLNGHTLRADYSFNIIDYFPSGYSYAAKSFIYLSGDSSLDIKNGTMNIKFDYKNRAATATGSSVYTSGKYAAIYVHNSPDNPGKSNPDAIYDIPYQSKLSMKNCTLKANQIPLYLGQGAHVTELNANLEYYVESVEATADGKSQNVYEMNIQNSDGYCCIYADAGSKISKISGGSYISKDQRVLDRNNGLTAMGFYGNNLYSLRVSAGFDPSATYFPNVHVPQAQIDEISGGEFKSTSSNGPANYIWGYIGKISGGKFAYYEGTWVNRNNQYINPPLKIYSSDCVGSICGGTFVAGVSKSRPDNPLINLIWIQSPNTFPDFSTIIDEGYQLELDHDADETFDCGGTVGEITFSGYKVVPAA